MDSSIYRNLSPEIAMQCGYFEPKESFYPLNGHRWAENDTTDFDQVVYFPGSFGSFHDGHISLCKRALEKYPNAKLVIAPSNSDYTSEKYGVWSERASNKHRYRVIRKALAEHNIQAYVDIDPMINHRCDRNFTDQLDSFLWNSITSLDTIRNKPIILAGKDRSNFCNLNDHQNIVKVEWFEDNTELSTSKTPNLLRKKKHLLLRVTNTQEYMLFKEYFEDQYINIRPIYLSEEIKHAKFTAKIINATHTNCKEYADFLEYFPVHRRFQNPLLDSEIKDEFDIPDGCIVLDSDSYSGSTQQYIESKNASMHALINLQGLTEDYELLDIWDFRDPGFAYPFVDISSRCSMQAFTYDFHSHFDKFKDQLAYV